MNLVLYANELLEPENTWKKDNYIVYTNSIAIIMDNSLIVPRGEISRDIEYTTFVLDIEKEPVELENYDSHTIFFELENKLIDSREYNLVKRKLMSDYNVRSDLMSWQGSGKYQ